MVMPNAPSELPDALDVATDRTTTPIGLPDRQENAIAQTPPDDGTKNHG